MQNQVAGLAGAVADIRAAYSYSFRFKGSQILDQRWPPNRIYFYAKPDYAVEMDIYLATRKFPVILKVDGVAMRPVIRDSQQGIQLTGRLTYTSLTEVTPAKVDTSPTDISPSSIEEPRPANMHYIEFLPGNVAFQFSNDDDFDISGILRVWRPITATKNEN
ncbi:MAG: hypothetical protein QM576_15615 [Rhodopseudomonas sp.]|uniref:hypothetical protein n=1 Tax=Rhodopseudomonas sp. TaxID=1078 RepID=UPI0039E4777C